MTLRIHTFGQFYADSGGTSVQGFVFAARGDAPSPTRVEVLGCALSQIAHLNGVHLVPCSVDPDPKPTLAQEREAFQLIARCHQPRGNHDA